MASRFRIRGTFVLDPLKTMLICYTPQNAGLALEDLENRWTKKTEGGEADYRPPVLLL